MTLGYRLRAHIGPPGWMVIKICSDRALEGHWLPVIGRADKYVVKVYRDVIQAPEAKALCVCSNMEGF